jgi:hypothetical protein
MQTNDRRHSKRSYRPRALTSALASAAGLTLAACGGGGGSASPAPPATPPTLSVSTAASSALPSGGAVSVEATLTNGTGTPAWSLEGPGSLSATSGNVVSYLPPSSEAFDQGATVTVTATVDGLSKAAQIQLQAATVPGHRWEVGRVPDVSWSEVDYANGNFVAVGRGGSVSTSADAQTWNRQDTPRFANWKSATYGSAGWIALGDSGELMTSPDAMTWTASPPLDPVTPRSMLNIAAGNGAYVAAGWNGSFASADGKTWQSVMPRLEAVAFGDGVFVGLCVDVAGSAPTFVVSADGVNWPTPNACQQPQNTGDAAKVVFGNGVFVVADMTNGQDTVLTSPDGRIWTRLSHPPSNFDSAGLAFANGLFYLPSTSSSGAYTSPDGQTWTFLSSQATFWQINESIAGSGTAAAAVLDGSLFGGAAVGVWSHIGTYALGDLVSVDYANGQYIAISTSRVYLTSTDGRLWSEASWPQGNFFKASAVKQGPGGTFVAGGNIPFSVGAPSGNEFFFSTDGATWQMSAPLMGDDPSDTITGLALDLNGWVAASAGGAIYTSPSGSYFMNTAKLNLASAQVTDIAFGGSRYVVVGSGGYAAVSTDAAAWTVAPMVMSNATPPAAVKFHHVAYDGKRFIAACDGGLIAVSDDGLAWTVVNSATTLDLSGIAVASTGEIVATGVRGLMETSIDATTWTVRTPVTTRDLNAVAAVNGGFIAVGNDGAIELSTH